jgi:hypothetical protein
MDVAVIEKAVGDLLALFGSIAPSMKPNIFPSYLPITSPACFFLHDENQHSAFREWLLKNNCDSSEVAMQTTVDYQNRKIIVNKIMVRSLSLSSPLPLTPLRGLPQRMQSSILWLQSSNRWSLEISTTQTD